MNHRVSLLTWVVFGRIGDDVMDVMMVLPPADGYAAEQIGNEDANVGIDTVRMRDAQMACVVSREC